MSKEQYIKLMSFWGSHKSLLTAAEILQKSAVFVVYASFPLLLIFLFFNNFTLAVRVFLTCGISFLLASVIRARLNKPRPYEVFEHPSAIRKDKKGNSFPSRHVFSATIIALCFFYTCPIAGIVFFLIAGIIAAMRVLLGVHFIKDVLFGAFLGILFGTVGLSIIIF